MYEWNETVQKMLDWIEKNIGENPMLQRMSEQVGYSTYYCSVQFHKICGMTLRSYISGRRLTLAALALRDTKERIIDIALSCGFSSQEALTRAFVAAFGCTPAAYRRKPMPIPLPIKKVIFFPEHYSELYKGDVKMSTVEARVRVEFIPAHKYIGIWDDQADGYCGFWENRDCDAICGTIDSMSNVSDPIITCHTAGWLLNGGKRRYFYGLGVPADFSGAVPDEFEIRDIPASYYLVFYHPPFDYLKDNGEVMGKVERLAWKYDIGEYGGGRFMWDESLPCYQRHYPEGIGYEVLRPIKAIANSIRQN